MEISGNFERQEREEDELPEPFLEHQLPWVTVRGLRESRVVVLGGATELVSRLPVVGYVMRRFATPIFGRPPIEKAPGALHEAVTFREFCRENPHPGADWTSPQCEKNQKSFDFSRGADVCAFCRDRLALWESLLAAPAVRAVPAG